MVAQFKFENDYVISSHTFKGSNYLSMLGSRLIHVNKRGPRYVKYLQTLQLRQQRFPIPVSHYKGHVLNIS